MGYSFEHCQECSNVRGCDDCLHMSDLANLEQEGRLVKLPCRIGETLWRVQKTNAGYFIRTTVLNQNNFWRIMFGGELGTKVFATREEALVALREQRRMGVNG